MFFVCVSDVNERVLSSQTVPGNCPFCGGMIRALDVQSQWRLCFIPLFWKTKRKLLCTVCNQRLVAQY
ncbi:uncharacterized protein LOC133818922 [Humulus lupulus]|uniref:uncharacterized protein LOC133818922 n=1 Tax=Humulus lupulus TaxID=3486 RepID=UPI002B403271|nr:uncharacterized protein LOC133818922 [Humulus lupulus]